MRGGLVLGLVVLALAVSAEARPPNAVVRALDDLRTCNRIDDPVCRGIPGRLKNYGARAVKPLMKAFPKLSPAGQLLGVVALRGIDSKKSTKALIVLSADSGYLIRTVSLAALGERKGSVVDNALIKALADDATAIRAAAAESLGKVMRHRDMKRTVPALVKAAADSAMTVRVASLESLGFLGAVSALDTIVGALDSRQLSVRKSAVFSLRLLGDKRSAPALIELLKEDDRVLVDDASKALERITGRDFGIDYEMWRSWWSVNKDDVDL